MLISATVYFIFLHSTHSLTTEIMDTTCIQFTDRHSNVASFSMQTVGCNIQSNLRIATGCWLQSRLSAVLLEISSLSHAI